MPGTRFKVPMAPPSQLTLSLDNRRFCSYHEANPQVYVEFRRITFETMAKGFKNYSANGIFELIRWHTGVTANGDCFKVNNDYRAFYARLFEQDFPQHKGFFRTRKSKFD